MTNKIEKWHESMSLKKKGTFHDDCDFIEIGSSPSRFETSFEEDNLSLENEVTNPIPFSIEHTILE